MRGPPAHLEELACPCCLPALGEFGEVPPRGGSAPTLDECPGGRASGTGGRLWSAAPPRVTSSTEDSHSGLVRALGTVSYTHLRAHETDSYLVCRLLLEK